MTIALERCPLVYRSRVNGTPVLRRRRRPPQPLQRTRHGRLHEIKANPHAVRWGSGPLWNTATGGEALAANTTGSNNTASGYAALKANTTGADNVAIGYRALYSNTTGTSNVATGLHALYFNTTGTSNVATGTAALAGNTTGYSNVAIGEGALAKSISGGLNVATGTNALFWNTTGGANVASGYHALYNNATGNSNVASGHEALFNNSDGFYNVASGTSALWSNTTGTHNVATGVNALLYSTTGHRNVALGYQAGLNATTGSDNVYIANPGAAGESGTIYLGTAGTQTRTFIAGIRGVTTASANAVSVLIDSAGQLGTVSSSRRVKDDVADMADASRGLLKLRPVTFHYKSDQNPAGRTLQYGLIAEEVAEVYPGLVAHSADGQVETVMYQFLPPMLLNEIQKQQRTIDELRAQVAALTQAVAALRDRKQ